MRIALISDTHVATIAADFVANCQAAIDWSNTDGIDLVIHLGDLTADGVAASEQVAQARALFDSLTVPLLCIPGNHDVGDNPLPGRDAHEPLLDAEALTLFRHAFGPDRWLYPAGDWALIGLNAQLFGTGGTEEKEQWTWLQNSLRQVNGPIGLFLHKPLFRDSLHDDERHPRYVPLCPRLALADQFSGYDLRFVASGHTHQLRRIIADGIEHFWVPSTAFVVPDKMQEWIGEKVVGAALLTLNGDRHVLDFVRIAGARANDLGQYRALFPQLDAILGE